MPALWIADRAAAAAGLPAIIWVSAAAVVAAMPTTVIVTGIVATLYGLSRPPSVLVMYGYVFSISLPMQALSYAVLCLSSGSGIGEPSRRASSQVIQPILDESEVGGTCKDPISSSFFDRIPAHLGRDLVCLEMQDHYIRVHTALGSALLLMRMGDAQAALDDIEGARVHRSWWVARGAARRVVRQGRSVTIALSNGLTVPVSRARIADLRNIGWFD